MGGWHSCGCVMDDLRYCYRSSMRLFKDRPDVLVPGQWFWCPPGAKRVPYKHPFTSTWLLPEVAKVDQPLGEVIPTGEIVDGTPNPRYLGLNVCGSADVWANGILYADRGTPLLDNDGVPPCCFALPGPPGGASAGGESEQGKVTGFAFDEGYDLGYDAPG